MSTNLTTTTTQQPQEPPQIFINIAYILSILELIIHPFILSISLFNLLILIKNNILHQNLRVLLIGQSLTIILFEIQREILVSQKIVSGDIFNPGFITLQVIIKLISREEEIKLKLSRDQGDQLG